MFKQLKNYEKVGFKKLCLPPVPGRHRRYSSIVIFIGVEDNNNLLRLSILLHVSVHIDINNKGLLCLKAIDAAFFHTSRWGKDPENENSLHVENGIPLD